MEESRILNSTTLLTLASILESRNETNANLPFHPSHEFELQWAAAHYFPQYQFAAHSAPAHHSDPLLCHRLKSQN